MADLMKTLPHWAAMRENVLVDEIQDVEFSAVNSEDDARLVVEVKYVVATPTVVEIPMDHLSSFIQDLMEVEKQRLEKETSNA